MNFILKGKCNMSKFDPELIRDYISKHESDICCVLTGYNYAENDHVWFSSIQPVYCNGNYVFNPDHLNERIPNETPDENPDKIIRRIPHMQIIFNNGFISILQAFKPEA